MRRLTYSPLWPSLFDSTPRLSDPVLYKRHVRHDAVPGYASVAGCEQRDHPLDQALPLPQRAVLAAAGVLVTPFHYCSTCGRLGASVVTECIPRTEA